MSCNNFDFHCNPINENNSNLFTTFTNDFICAVLSVVSQVSDLEDNVQSLQQVWPTETYAIVWRVVSWSLNHVLYRIHFYYSQLLTQNECNSNPCRNGGTCVDRYNGFFCQCPPAWKVSYTWSRTIIIQKRIYKYICSNSDPDWLSPWWFQGAFCDVDVNECAEYAGTDLGCQNGATCVNNPGSFTWVQGFRIRYNTTCA